jgi:hypothetical protein
MYLRQDLGIRSNFTQDYSIYWYMNQGNIDFGRGRIQLSSFLILNPTTGLVTATVRKSKA